MSKYQPNSIDDLIANAKMQLGDGVIKINVSYDQCVMAVQKAIDLYVEYHYDATEHVYVATELTPEDAEKGYITTPKEVVNVIRILGTQTYPSAYGTNMRVRGSHVGSWLSGGNIANLGDARGVVGSSNRLTSIYLAEAHRAFFNKIVYPNIPIDWNKNSKRIRFLGDMSRQCNCNPNNPNALVYEAYVVNEDLHFDCQNDIQANTTFYDNEWLKEYSAARIAKFWGQNLSKFDVQLATGMQMNGAAILDKAERDIERLEEQLFARYTYPAMMITG